MAVARFKKVFIFVSTPLSQGVVIYVSEKVDIFANDNQLWHKSHIVACNYYLFTLSTSDKASILLNNIKFYIFATNCLRIYIFDDFSIDLPWIAYLTPYFAFCSKLHYELMRM